MEITERLRRTLKALDDAEIPRDLRPVAFGKAFDSLGEPSQGSTDTGTTGAMSAGGGTDGLNGIATRFAMPRELIERAFVLEQDQLELVIPAARFDAAKSRATEQIALLVAAARQASGLDKDGWTSVDHIRAVCEDFKRYDSGNFAATIKDMDDVLSVRGSGRTRKVRMTAPAWQRARDLLAGLMSSS